MQINSLSALGLDLNHYGSEINLCRGRNNKKWHLPDQMQTVPFVSEVTTPHLTAAEETKKLRYMETFWKTCTKNPFAANYYGNLLRGKEFGWLFQLFWLDSGWQDTSRSRIIHLFKTNNKLKKRSKMVWCYSSEFYESVLTALDMKDLSIAAEPFSNGRVSSSKKSDLCFIRFISYLPILTLNSKQVSKS